MPEYENVEVQFIGGRSPELYFFDKDDNKIETIDLTPLSRDDAEQLLIDRGFQKKSAASDGKEDL